MFNQRDKSLLLALVLAVFSAMVSAECPNACSSHGKCGAFDACECYRNWMSNDCSERICQFGLAHVDTPKGDLDSSSGELYSPEALTTNAISSGSRVASPLLVNAANPNPMYPKGTYEKFPSMVNSANYILSNTAHDYMECSNKGVCDRADGTCQCFEGYDGSSCQRASCPVSNNGVCSGHGTCSTIKEIARAEYNNTYTLWDEHMTMGCVCDPGFEGPDCSKAMCKFGADPLYYDDEFNERVANFTFALWNIDTKLDSDDLAAGLANPKDTIRSARWAGNFSIVFYDAHGEAWHTDPIDIKADCDAITTALESIPNNVIKANSVLCAHDDTMYGTYLFDNNVATTVATGATTVAPKILTGVPDGYPIALPAGYVKISGAVNTGTLFPYTGKKFTLAFPSNPGKLRQPEINVYLDGARPTVTTGATTVGFGASPVDNFVSSKVRTWVWANGFTGETDDFVPDYCAGVTVTIDQGAVAGWGKLVLSADEAKLLKVCLGDADGDATNNNKVGFTNAAKDADEALFNWDYGIEAAVGVPGGTYAIDNLLHPHLIKLVDKTATSATKLCSEQDGFYTGVDEILSAGFCANPNPAGFYAVLFYDATTASAGTFNFLSRSYEDYSTLTEFHVFTTSGYLSSASITHNVFTSFGTVADAGTEAVGDTVARLGQSIRDLTSFYSNVVYTAKKVSTNAGDDSNIDCETNPTAYKCIEKGDYVMIMDVTPGTTNPKYPNIYQVMKISRENRESVANTGANDYAQGGFETYRYQIVLDYGVNARFNKVDATTDNTVRIFKFTPPTNAVTWVGQCSQRGICDHSNGQCQCFPGYTNDNCDTMNALAQ